MSKIINLDSPIPGAPNFTYRDFVKSELATRNNIANIPNDQQWTNIEKLAVNAIQPIRNHFGPIKISSGFRCLALNEKAGSSPSSNHVFGLAADIEPVDPKIKLFTVLEYIALNLPFKELIAEFFPDGWVHVAYQEGANKKVIKLKDKNHNFEVVTLDQLRKIYG